MKRNSSFELLRLILMAMIIVHHIIVHGFGIINLYSQKEPQFTIDNAQIPIALFVNAFCICAVNCFVLISGYYGIRPYKRKVILLLSIVLLYTILLSTIPYIVEKNYKEALKSLLFLSHSEYWFVIDYMFLIAFAPILNIWFETGDRKSINYCIIAIIIMNCYFGFLWNHTVNSSGYNLMQFIMMYCIGRWIFLNEFSMSKFYSLSIYIVCSTVFRIGNVFPMEYRLFL